MSVRPAALAALLGLSLASPELAQAELTLAIFKVTGMVCPA
jgi:hypothetical protein